MTERTHLSSDLHLWHLLVSHLRGYGDSRETADVEGAVAEIEEHWDSNVKPKENVVLVGDMLANARHTARMLEWISERPGTKHLISGNHDATHPMHRGWMGAVQTYTEQAFATVSPLGCLRIAGRKVLVSHFPYLGEGSDHEGIEPRYPEWRPADHGLWLIHGHTHLADQKLHGRQIHVGWDAWRRFVTTDEIASMIEATESA